MPVSFEGLVQVTCPGAACSMGRGSPTRSLGTPSAQHTILGPAAPLRGTGEAVAERRHWEAMVQLVLLAPMSSLHCPPNHTVTEGSKGGRTCVGSLLPSLRPAYRRAGVRLAPLQAILL